MTTMTRDTEPSPQARREPSTTQLVLDLELALDELPPLAGRVAELVDVRKPQLKFLSPDARDALDQAARDERTARYDTTGRSSRLGLKWLRGRETDARLGVGQLVGRPAAISADAEIAFTLADLIRRLDTGLTRAGIQVCVIPRLPAQPTVTDMVEHLRRLVHVTADEGWHRLLVQARRDVEALVSQAKHVIHGPESTTFGDCPHCGRPTIVVNFADATIRCDVDRKTNQHEPCVCGDPYCRCKYQPVEFRHEWRRARTIAASGWATFKRLRAQREADQANADQAAEAVDDPDTSSTRGDTP